jgi:hypothetical protein
VTCDSCLRSVFYLNQPGDTDGVGPVPVCERPVMSENNTRVELFAAVKSLSEAVPEMRAGQLVAAIGEFCAACTGVVCGTPPTQNFLKLCGSSIATSRP